MGTADETQLVPDDDAHRIWKRSAAPMYDWLTNHHLVWPSLTCRFGAAEHKGDVGKYEQTVYYSEQVDKDEKVHNKLISQVVSVHEGVLLSAAQRVVTRQAGICNGDSRMQESYTPIDHINNWKENQKSPYFSKSQAHIINHPGECNKIRTIPQMSSMVVTHSDCADVFVWDFTKQPSHHANNSKGKRGTRSVPDLKLTGHTDLAPFALTSSSASACVSSGGDDTNVLLWQLQDKSEGGTDGSRGARTVPDTLAPRQTFKGHTKTVSDVCFKPGSDSMLVSSSDDHIIKTWDTREEAAVKDVLQASQDDVLAVDWSADGHYIATGDSKGCLQVYDLRAVSDSQASKPVHRFPSTASEPKAVLTVAWNPLRPSWLACGGDDGRVSVYDTARPDADTVDKLPAQLVLQHVGHLGNIMDAQWSPHDPFLMMSVSNDGHTYKEGGACQLWRLSWLLHADLADAEAQLRGYQAWLESGKLADLQDVIRVDMSQPGERPGASTRDGSPAAMQQPPPAAAKPQDDARALKSEDRAADMPVDAAAPAADVDMADAAAAPGNPAAQGEHAAEGAMDDA